jgi:hypothetical protein
MSEREALPADPPEKGTLYVAPPLAHTRGKLRRLLWESDLRFGGPSEGVKVRLENDRVQAKLGSAIAWSGGVSAASARTSRSRPSWGGVAGRRSR